MPLGEAVHTPTSGDRLRAAEVTMRLRTSAAGRVVTSTPTRSIGCDDAGRPVRPAAKRREASDDQDDVEEPQSVARFGGRLPALAGYRAQAGA